ncbi:MAG TPA: hypothetical protein VIC71_06010 [Gammaproteobacteria bacterium]|jgi:ABC-type uncharacterized transport system permease subunit
MNNLEFLIPIIFFVCIAYIIKAILESRTRAKLIAANSSEELIRSLLVSEEQQRRQTSLRWGIVLSCLAGGFALIQTFGYNDVTPGAIAVLLGATGVGNLAFYAIARNLPK